MELLVCAILFMTDDPAASQAVHYARQAEGFVRSRTCKWKTLDDVEKSLGPCQSISVTIDSDRFVWWVREYKCVGLVVRFRSDVASDRVVDVSWHFQPFDPTAPRFHILPERLYHGRMTIAGS